MVALILWLTFGSRAAAAEVFVELAVGLLLYGTHAGGRPVWRSRRPRRAPKADEARRAGVS